jgi:hypothetical protein
MSDLIANPDFEADAAGWVAGANFGIARDTAHVSHGTGSLKTTVTSTGAAATLRAAAYLGISVPTGQQLVAAAKIWIPSVGWTAANVIKLQWLDGAAAAADLNSAQADMSLVDQWQTLFVQAVSNGSSNQGVRIYALANATLGEFFWIDQATLAPYGTTGQHEDAETVYASLIAKGYKASEAAKVAARLP